MNKTITKCFGCDVEPNHIHLDGCDIERCSVCGLIWVYCNCVGHDREYAKWVGYLPCKYEAIRLKIKLSEFYTKDYYRVFFIKPKEKQYGYI